MKGLLIILNVFLVVWTSSAQTNYKVINTAGKVLVNNVLLKKGSAVTIRPEDKIRFEPATAKAAIYNKAQGVAILYSPKKQTLDVKEYVEGKVENYFKLVRKSMTTRSVDLRTVEDFKAYFGENFMIFDGEIRVKISPSSPFAVSANRHLVLSYHYSESTTPIDKLIPVDGYYSIFSRSEIYKIDGAPISESKVSEMSLFHYNFNQDAPVFIINCHLDFINNNEMIDELEPMVQFFKEEGYADKKIVTEVEKYLSAFGEFDDDNLRSWLSKYLKL